MYTVREDVSKLSYITMCIKESLRLYPPASLASKLLANDCEMNGCRIPKGICIVYCQKYYIYSSSIVGAMVFIGIHTIHHDSLVWDDPEVNSLIKYMLCVICYILSEI